MSQARPTLSEAHMNITQVPSAKLTDGRTVHKGDVIQGHGPEKFFVAGIIAIEDQGDTATAVVLSNLTNGRLFPESLGLFESQVEDGDYILP